MESSKNNNFVDNPYLASCPPNRQKRPGSTMSGRSKGSRGKKTFFVN